MPKKFLDDNDSTKTVDCENKSEVPVDLKTKGCRFLDKHNNMLCNNNYVQTKTKYIGFANSLKEYFTTLTRKKNHTNRVEWVDVFTAICEIFI